MVEKLSITIGLEGGAEIQRQLADIGEAGQKAFLDISKAAQQAGGFKNLKPEEVTAKLKEMGIVGVDALKKIQNAVASAAQVERLVGVVQKLEAGFIGASKAAAGLALVLGPLIAVAALVFVGLVKAASDAAVAIGKVEAAAAKAGLSIETYDRLRAALEKVGISAKGAGDAIQKASQAADAAKIEKVTASFKTLQAVMASGSDPRTSPALQQLLTMAQGFGPVADAAKKALADLNIQFTASEQKLQQMASSGTQSLQQLAAGLSSVTVPGGAFVGALDQIRTGSDRTSATLQGFITQLEGIKDPAERNKIAFQQMGDAGLEISKAINTGALSSKQSLDQLAAGATTLNQSMANTAATIEQSMNRMESSFDRLKTVGITTMWDNFASSGNAAINTVSGTMDGLLSKLREAAELTSQMSGGGGGGGLPAHARGGLLGGTGTGTSDSNLAWVSRGEHIMPARAVSQPGVLALLEALRRNGGDLSRVLDRMGHFATGGLVGLPAFASGGGGMSHVTIAFPGLPAISGLRASSDVVEQLQRAAAMAQVRSGGRKPSRYG